MGTKAFFAGGAAVTFVIAACGADERSTFYPGSEVDGDGGPPGTAPGQTFTPGGGACEGLGCAVVDCAKDGKPKTTITGKVYDPAGVNPLYNVMVYIPGGATPETLPPLKDSTKEPTGIACETCASVVVNPVRSALTDGTGSFKLEDVPVTKNLPIVLQVGKWRRLVHLDVAQQCADNPVVDTAFRLPKNGSEGDMPQMAVTSGSADAFECFLRGVGVDESEFVSGHGGAGHVHLFKGAGGGMGTPAKDFWNDAAQLKKYDMVLLSCEGAEHNELKGTPGWPWPETPDARGSMRDYLNAGGKVFATHYHYTWFKNSPLAAFKSLADWAINNTSTGVQTFDINQSFPKGAKFAEWLTALGVSSMPGKIDLEGVTNSLEKANPPVTPWIQSGNGNIKYFTFNTPLGEAADKQCGRAVFSDVHTASAVGELQSTSPSSIDKCPLKAGQLNNKQKAIEFLFFDLSACVSAETVDPQPPR